MSTFKKITLCCCILFTYYALSNNTVVRDELDDFDFFNDLLTNSFVEQTQWNLPTRDKQDVINLLEEVAAIDLLKEDFFLNTNPLTTRDLLDEPFALIQGCFCSPGAFAQRSIGFDIFYNQTTRMVFKHESTNIDSYLAIRCESFLQKLRNTVDRLRQLEPAFDLDVDQITRLFQNLTVQERRAGFMFYGKKTFDSNHHYLSIGFQIPVYYLEHNYFLTDEEQSAIQQEFGSLDPGNQCQFEDDHFICDKFGFGDSRFSFEVPIRDSDLWEVAAGGFVTIPTAGALGTGIFRGSSFKPFKCRRPVFDLELLTQEQAFQDDVVEQQMLEFLLNALDHLSAHLLDTTMGNGGHFGIGISFRTKSPLEYFIRRPWAHRFRMKTRYSIEYLLPARETRYFIQCNNPTDFDKRDFNNPNQTDCNFAFLSQMITNRLFPYALNTTVYPNLVCRSTTRFLYKGSRVALSIGTDTWIVTKEALRNISYPFALTSSCTPVCLYRNLDIRKATRALAYQGKVFISAMFKHCGKNNKIWSFCFHADQTFSSSGIGKDFVLAFKVNCSF
jgi:hypothetical protein